MATLINYYVNARLNGKVALLAGPFFSKDEAGNVMEICAALFMKECPESIAASFGIMEAKENDGFGRYNLILAQAGVNVMLPDPTADIPAILGKGKINR